MRWRARALHVGIWTPAGLKEHGEAWESQRSHGKRHRETTKSSEEPGHRHRSVRAQSRPSLCRPEFCGPLTLITPAPAGPRSLSLGSDSGKLDGIIAVSKATSETQLLAQGKINEHYTAHYIFHFCFAVTTWKADKCVHQGGQGG